MVRGTRTSIWKRDLSFKPAPSKAGSPTAINAELWRPRELGGDEQIGLEGR